MRCSEIIRRLEQLAPLSYACDWDNPGLQTGRMDKDVKRILIALDATDEVIEESKKQEVDLLLTHHPLIFRPVKKINDQDVMGRRLLELIRADIACYSMHTNFDVAPGCMADLAADRLNLKQEGPLEITGEQGGISMGIGKTGRLEQPMTLEALGAFVKERFNLPFVTVYGLGQKERSVSRIGIAPGAGGSMIAHGCKARVDVLITGDIGHHQGIDAVAEGMAVIDAGHYGLEHIFIEYMNHYLREQMGTRLEIISAKPSFPSEVI